MLLQWQNNEFFFHLSLIIQLYFPFIVNDYFIVSFNLNDEQQTLIVDGLFIYEFFIQINHLNLVHLNTLIMTAIIESIGHLLTVTGRDRLGHRRQMTRTITRRRRTTAEAEPPTITGTRPSVLGENNKNLFTVSSVFVMSLRIDFVMYSSIQLINGCLNI